MQIDIRQTEGKTTLLLNGRLDVTWADFFLDTIREELRNGHHILRLDASALNYLSSAGIRALLLARREINAVHGTLFLERASDMVAKTLHLAGLDDLLQEPRAPSTPPPHRTTPSTPPPPEPVTGPEGMRVMLHRLAPPEPMTISIQADWLPWQTIHDHTIQHITLPPRTTALGIGAAGHDPLELKNRFGEFLATAGCLAWQPADMHEHRPDYTTHKQQHVPDIQAIQALTACGTFPHLLRFSPEQPGQTLPFAQLARLALHLCNAEKAVLVTLAEAEALVGTTLSQSPGLIQPDSHPAQFPNIRDWMNFCGERAHAGRSILSVSFIAREQTAATMTPFLAPLPSLPGILAHTHAAAFPFQPLPEGPVQLEHLVPALFEHREPLEMLHLLDDQRPAHGLGQSAFIRGACWCAPAITTQGRTP